MALWIAGLVAVAAAAAVALATERAARRGPRDLDPRDARFGRPIVPRGHGARFARTFRWWAWAGAACMALGGALLALASGETGWIDLALTLIGTALLVWVLGGGLAIARAYDPPMGDDEAPDGHVPSDDGRGAGA